MVSFVPWCMQVFCSLYEKSFEKCAFRLAQKKGWGVFIQRREIGALQ